MTFLKWLAFNFNIAIKRFELIEHFIDLDGIVNEKLGKNYKRKIIGNNYSVYAE